MSPVAKPSSLTPVELHQRVPAGLSSTVIRRWARRWSTELGFPQRALSIATVGPAEMHRLNATWRRKDRPTNVLSFVYDAQRSTVAPAVWGEIILCPSVIRQELARYERSYAQHFLRLLQHGLIHLTGRDHKQSRDLAGWQRLERKLSFPR